VSLRVDRRKFLMGSTALLAAGAAGMHPAFAQDKSLRLIFWGSQARADRTYGVTDLYAKQANVAIEGEFLAWGDYWTKLATQTAGGNAPDIIQMDYRYIVEYATRDAIAPLDDYVGGVLDVAGFAPAQVEGGKVGGALYGVSLGANSSTMLLNKAAFEEAGVPLPDQSTTWDDFARLAAEIHKASPRENFYGSQDASGNEPTLENWLRQRGKALYTAEGQVAFDAEDMSDWFEMFAKMRESGAIVPADVQAAANGGLEVNVLNTGRAAIGFDHSNQLVAYQAINPEPLTISNKPRVGADGKGGHYRKPSMFFSVGASSADKEAAAAFINFFVNDLEAVKILGVERGIPEDQEARDALIPTLDELGQTAVSYVANLGDLAGPLPPPPPTAAGEIQSALQRKAEEVAFGAQSVADAGPAFVTEATEILSRAS
jgi:multiple sugar transport system substrate-binding protein